MAKPQHRTPEHRAAYKKLRQDQARGVWLTCVQGLDGSSGSCLYVTRDITPTQPAHVAHDDSGTRIIGVSHAACNVKDGAQRRHAKPAPRRWIL